MMSNITGIIHNKFFMFKNPPCSVGTKGFHSNLISCWYQHVRCQFRHPEMKEVPTARTENHFSIVVKHFLFLPNPGSGIRETAPPNRRASAARTSTPHWVSGRGSSLAAWAADLDAGHRPRCHCKEFMVEHSFSFTQPAGGDSSAVASPPLTSDPSRPESPADARRARPLA